VIVSTARGWPIHGESAIILTRLNTKRPATRLHIATTEGLIHALFEAQVARTAHSVAVICEDESLTYAELNARANRLARHLRERGVGPDRLVGICLERSVSLVVGLLAILKAGGGYVPLDPAYPADRE